MCKYQLKDIVGGGYENGFCLVQVQLEKVIDPPAVD